MPKPQLISFKLCPFVQRSVSTLLYKNVDFDITYIDLANKPAWFLELSPLGKVPVLRVGDTTLFESAVINEYLDETNGEPMHPADALKKAENRAYIEYGSNLLFLQYSYTMAKDQPSLEKARQAFQDKLLYLEKKAQPSPYFNGESLSLVDMAYAPLFMRQQLIEEKGYDSLLQEVSALAEWGEQLCQLACVKNSVVADFADLFFQYLSDNNSHLAAG